MVQHSPRTLGPHKADATNDAARTNIRLAVLSVVSKEREKQIARYGHNDNLYDGSGPATAWLAPFTGHDATVIEEKLREDYVEFEQETGHPTWVHLIREEVAEAFKEEDPELLVGELVQVAALCVSWIEQLYLRGARPVPQEA